MTKSFFTLYTLFTIFLAIGKLASGQNCGCAPNLCCSFYGYCGIGYPYCGPGCQSGPCYPPSSRNNGVVAVSDLVTSTFFNGIISQARLGCAGRGFYTWAAFLSALDSFPRFGADGSTDARKREVAAFFAHVTHETESLCHIEDTRGPPQPIDEYCKKTEQWSCAARMRYFGRGPLKLSWNYNYIAAGHVLNFDGLNNPDVVAQDPAMAFKTSLWFWMINCHNAIISGQGFGATIRSINNGKHDCNGTNPTAITSRVNYYTKYCNEFGVNPGNNLQC